MTAVLVAIGAAVGAPLRWVVERRFSPERHRGTVLVNLVGSLLAGGFAGLALDGRAWALLATGFCGALTTYSGFAVQATEMRRRQATGYVAATAVGAVLAAVAGFAIGAAV